MTFADLPLRIVPAQLLHARRPQRLLERHFIINRSGGWMIVLTGFFEPLFYLLSIRVGFGALVGDVTDGGQTIPYAEFVAPALMAAAAMNGAVFESTMNVFFQLRYDKVYDAALATPLTSGDVALGEIGYATFRGSLYSVAFLITIVALGMARSPWIVLALPVCVLIAIAFSAVGMALTTFMRGQADFEYVATITLPMFLFSATFYPIASYGDWGWLVQLSPLYHGVALVRGASFGEWSWAYIGHISVLVALAIAGLSVTARRIEHLLLQ
jgi:lipooligosaccharide transport system permease protein